MVSKVLKIILNAILSVAVFFAAAVLTAEIFGWVFGTTKDSTGQKTVNGGSWTSILVLIVGAAAAIAFAAWFYKFLNRKNNVVKEEK